jgi:uncharacterized membrane protein YtjA (UPF0391 family)
MTRTDPAAIFLGIATTVAAVASVLFHIFFR